MNAKGANSAARLTGGARLVAIVVLNWNGWRETVECLESLKAQTRSSFRVIVVDNGSRDESVSRLAAWEPWIRLVRLAENRGFAGGNNAGIQSALEEGAKFVLLLNNDTVVAPDLIDAFARAADRHPSAAAFGGRIYYHDEPSVLWFAGGEFRTGLEEPKHRGLNERDAPAFAIEESSPFITGCALFVRASLFQEVGLLDERFFCMWEDAEWCWRAGHKGLELRYVPAARLWHKTSRSFGGIRSPLAMYYYERNRLLFGECWVEGFQRGREIRAALRNLARDVRAEISLRRPWNSGIIWKSRRRLWAARLTGIRHFAERRWGRGPVTLEQT